MKRVLIFSFLFGFCASLMAKPVVANVRVSPRSGAPELVDVYYDLMGVNGSVIVSVVFSLNGSSSIFDVVPAVASLSGDIGVTTTSGANKHITWNAGADRPGICTTLCSAKVSVEDQSITIYLPGNVPLVMVNIPPGSYTMGANDNDSGWSHSEEYPAHMVNIAYSFQVGKFELTQKQWVALMGSNPSYFKGDNRPVEQVSWNDIRNAGGFLDKLNQHITATGQGSATFRLPSEAEWEYACRAGSTTRFSFGDSDCAAESCNICNLSDYAWYCGNNSPDGTKPVGGKLPNAFGLYDMHGNVWEWCEDWYHGSYTGAPADGNAWVSPTGVSRVSRGGCWNYTPSACRSATRAGQDPVLRHDHDGLRVARTINTTIQFSAASSSGSENVSPANLTVTLSEAAAITVTVNYAVTGGTATGGGTDYTLNAGTLTFTPGQTTQTLPITIINDLLDEPDETIVVDLSSPVNASLGSPSSHTYTIKDNDGYVTTIYLPGNVPLEMATIPSGSFEMGSNDNDSSWSSSSEYPTHMVNIAYSFQLGKFEMTQKQWVALMGSNPSYFKGDNRPVEMVSWNDIRNAGGFLEKLNQHITATGQGPATFRLPSESEWEYTCRAGSQTRFYFGDSDCAASPCNACNLDNYAWHCGNSGLQTYVVGGKLPNAFGLFDMHGNVSEWCEDWYHNSYTGAPTDGSAWVSPTGSSRVLHPGNWNCPPGSCRSAARQAFPPDARGSSFGFRLTRTQ